MNLKNINQIGNLKSKFKNWYKIEFPNFEFSSFNFEVTFFKFITRSSKVLMHLDFL